MKCHWCKSEIGNPRWITVKGRRYRVRWCVGCLDVFGHARKLGKDWVGALREMGRG